VTASSAWSNSDDVLLARYLRMSTSRNAAHILTHPPLERISDASALGSVARAIDPQWYCA